MALIQHVGLGWAGALLVWLAFEGPVEEKEVELMRSPVERSVPRITRVKTVKAVSGW